MPFSRLRVFGALLICAAAPSAPTGASAQEAITIVFDGSNSMWGQIDGRSKIEIARTALAGFVADWPDAATLGLIAFGHRREGDCGDIETLYPNGPADTVAIMRAVGGVVPRGKTPISAAVRQAAEELRYEERPATVVLFSDGVETCDADPCALAQGLAQAGVRFTAHVIGLDIKGDDNQLSCLAEATGGLYLAASTPLELREALSAVRAMAIEPEAEGRIVLEAAAVRSGRVLNEGVAWRVVSLETEAGAPLHAGVARPTLPLAPGRYLIEAQTIDAIGRAEIEVLQGEAATHRIPLEVLSGPSGVVGLGPIPEIENNDDFAAATRIAVAAEAAPPPQGRSLGDAIPIAADGRLIGTMNAGERSWWSTTVDSQGELRLRLVTLAEGARASVRIWSVDHIALSDWRDIAEGVDVLFDLPAAGTYILETALSEAGGDFAMDLVFISTGAARDPGPTFGEASPIAREGPVFLTILPKGDVDWLRFITPDQGALSVMLESAPEGVEPTIRLWDAGRNPLSGWRAPEAGAPAVFDIAAPGAYVLEVRDAGDDGRSPHSVSLRTAFDPTGDLGEPDNSFGAARPAAADGEVVGAIFPRDDVDWVRLSAPDQGALTLRLIEAPEAIQPMVRLWNVERAPLTRWLPLDAAPTVFDLATGGDYWLEIRDANNDDHATDAYHIDLAFAPTGETGEPNDHFADAAPFAPGTPIEGAILPQGDVDWRLLAVDSRGALVLTLAETPEGITLAARLWNAEVAAMSGWRTLTEEPLIFDLPKGGVYRLELRDSRDDGASADSYRIDTAFFPAVPAEVWGDGILTGALFPRGDADWYRLTAVEEGEMSLFLLETPDGVQPTARVWSAEQRAVTDWLPLLADGQSVAVKAALPTPGDYLIEIRDRGDDDRATEPYRIAVEWPGASHALPAER